MSEAEGEMCGSCANRRRCDGEEWDGTCPPRFKYIKGGCDVPVADSGQDSRGLEWDPYEGWKWR